MDLIDYSTIKEIRAGQQVYTPEPKEYNSVESFGTWCVRRHKNNRVVMSKDIHGFENGMRTRIIVTKIYEY